MASGTWSVKVVRGGDVLDGDVAVEGGVGPVDGDSNAKSAISDFMADAQAGIPTSIDLQGGDGRFWGTAMLDGVVMWDVSADLLS